MNHQNKCKVEWDEAECWLLFSGA